MTPQKNTAADDGALAPHTLGTGEPQTPSTGWREAAARIIADHHGFSDEPPTPANFACADALAALPAPGGWREIESALRDGTWFVALQDGLTYPCEWHETEPDEGPGRAGWWDHFNQSHEEPTHWMPLPEPPYSGGGKGG